MASEVGNGEGARMAIDEPSVARGTPVSAPGEEALSPTGRPSVARTAASPSGFLRRHRLPLALAAIALCLYAGSIVYILYGRGQIA